jgi:hypothetical protein
MSELSRPERIAARRRMASRAGRQACRASWTVVTIRPRTVRPFRGEKPLRLSSNSVHHYHGAGKTLKWRDSSKRPAMLTDKSHRMSATVPRELHYRNRGVIVNIYDGRDVYGYYFDR